MTNRMFSETVGQAEVLSDGKTVWVNGPIGWNVGRFSAAGMDFGLSSNLQNKAGPMTIEDWKHFCEGMLDVYGVRISEEHTPEFLKVPA